MVNSDPNHHFVATPSLIQNPELLQALKSKVTVEAADSMPKVAGMPPHVEQMKMMKSM